MIVTFISECENKALKRSRRVLDAFANRIGNNTWQTVITYEGLQAVKKLLRKTATKNTAVSCHKIKSRKLTELLWIVGSRNKFNNEGFVAVNYTEQDVFIGEDMQDWQTINIIKYASNIAGLFHDFGKANKLFQNKLNPELKTKNYEPYRHEWISLILFQTFVGNIKDDIQWLEKLSKVEKDERGLINNDRDNSTIINLPPFAKLVAWLIISHHKLPLYPEWKKEFNSPPKLKDIDNWLKNNFAVGWNSPNYKNQDLQDLVEQNWELQEDLPYKSTTWQSYARIIAKETKQQLQKNSHENYLDNQLFSTHLSRLCLILADHYYSSLSLDDIKQEYRDDNYKVWANTDKETKQYKQQLDEHLIGVGLQAKKIAKALLRLNGSLDSLNLDSKSKIKLTSNVEKNDEDDFGWQDIARKKAKRIGKETQEKGFFGINIASTGKGKTLANAKIITAIGNKVGRVRFSVALGLRTLTMQTGKEYRTELKLNDKELAIRIGSTAVKELFENQKGQELENNTGSESENFDDKELATDYSGIIVEHSLNKWTKNKKNLNKLICAPVLVSTIDHLVTATEGTRGDKHIASTLRLLTSDLVIDEPDDFNLDDLPALCRLVNWAGMLGSRVLLSTATMPPALANALFRAYYQGWKQYAKARLDNWNGEVLCAWFDEKKSISENHKDFNSFKESHKKFINKRIKKLDKLPIKRMAIIKNITEDNDRLVIENMAEIIRCGITELHERHNQSKNNKIISVGLVRMANINPLVAVAKKLLKIGTSEDINIYYCIYHSRYPLALRSYIENNLDKILKRKKPDAIWNQQAIKNKLDNSNKKHHIFVVIASPVAEVGRDHDYDWAVVEPSSMRSIIQLAGRVLRHRNLEPKQENIILLNKNYKALTSKYKRCFERPGFETNKFSMIDYDLNNILCKRQYENITAKQRIVLPEKYKTQRDKYCNLVELEHKALSDRLFSQDNGARLWWENSPSWCGEVQRQQQFRKSKQDESYYLCLRDKYSSLYWQWKNEHIYPAEFGEGAINITNYEFDKIADGNDFLFDIDVKDIYKELSKDFKIDLKQVSEKFGEVRLIEYENKQQEYNFNPNLGVYKDIGEQL